MSGVTVFDFGSSALAESSMPEKSDAIIYTQPKQIFDWVSAIFSPPYIYFLIGFILIMFVWKKFK